MPDTTIALDPPPPAAAVAAVPLQLAAGDGGVAAIAPVADAFRIRFKAHQTNHTLPYLDADGRGALADNVFARSRSAQPAPGGKPRGFLQPDAADIVADTRVTHAEIGAPPDWRLDARSGSGPVQWPVGYKEPLAAAPLDMDSVAGQTRRYVCSMAAIYGVHRALCAVCGNRHMPGAEETVASKALCDQFANALTIQWQGWRTFWTAKAWFNQQIPDPQQMAPAGGVQPQKQRLAVLRADFNDLDWPAALPRAIAM
jgi:hypothetical protein